MSGAGIAPALWPDLPAEDCYASAKKLAWFRSRLDTLRTERGRGLTVLDFGCGSAAHAGRYLMNAADSYTGVDIHEPSLAYARVNFAGPKARFLESPPDGERFDVIVVCEVLEHLDDPAGVLAALVKTGLVPDGRVLGSVPNGYGLTEIEKKVDRTLGLYSGLRAVVRRLRRWRGRPHPPPAAAIPYNFESGHVQFFTRRQLAGVARAAGLRLSHLVNGTVMGADLSGVTLLRPAAMIRANVRIADWLPHWAAATWFFEMAPDGAAWSGTARPGDPTIRMTP